MFGNWLQRAVWNNHCGPEWLGSHSTKNFLAILCWRLLVYIFVTSDIAKTQDSLFLCSDIFATDIEW